MYIREETKKIILITILAIAMVNLSLYDRHIIQEQMTEVNQQNKASRKRTQKIHVNSTIENTMDKYLELSNDYFVLAVGKVGNLKDGGQAPIYKYAANDSEIIAGLQYNCAILIELGLLKKNINYKWIPVNIPNKNQIGYVDISQIEIQNVKIKNPTDDPNRNQIVEDAISYIGLDFVRYGKSLKTGIDCSNFIHQIYGKAGIEIDNTPNGMKKQAQKVTDEEALPGDIVYYDVNNGGGHVGIYLGSGLIINSAGHEGMIYPEGGVRICRLRYNDREEYEFYRIIE